MRVALFNLNPFFYLVYCELVSLVGHSVDSATCYDAAGHAGAVVQRLEVPDQPDRVHAAHNATEGHFFTIEPRLRRQRDEELRAVRVWPSIGHGLCWQHEKTIVNTIIKSMVQVAYHNASHIVRNVKAFIRKLESVN